LAFVAATTAALLAASIADADARVRRSRAKSVYSPPYAALVVDANSGRVLHDTNGDDLRHPASLTKIMTLYLLFEQLEAGRVRLDTPLAVSEHASAQAPSKLGLRPGQSIEVEDAIKALVTKSANDVAVVVAEGLAGDEDTFAKLMTRKARALGMGRTVYRNASGLPDPEQVTSARDQVLLGRAIQDRFPRYYRYFSTSVFVYGGRAMSNHNRLLGRVAGIDGIKTGYTNASGFNLVSSVRRGNRHLVACVLGGSSGGARDARMRQLLEANLAEGTTQRTAARVDEGDSRARLASAESIPTRVTPREPLSLKPDLPPTRPEPAQAAALAPERMPASSFEPIKPVPVKTLAVKPGAIQAAMAAGPTLGPASRATAAAPRPGQIAMFGGSGPAASTQGSDTPAVRQAAAGADLTFIPESKSAASTPSATPQGEASKRNGWIIQIGAFAAETEAMERLRSAKTLATGLLREADPFTERVVRGETTLYRARFAGLDEEGAEAACRYLKRNRFSCLALKN
jgi:D-alanyl-D-alanine carboxypeptidase